MDRRVKSTRLRWGMRRVIRASTGVKTVALWSISSWQCGRLLGAFFRSRVDLALEILALRQQVAVLKRKRPRPPLNASDRLFWVLLRRLWSGWKDVLIVVKPDAVVGWHRAGFRWYWRWKSC